MFALDNHGFFLAIWPFSPILFNRRRMVQALTFTPSLENTSDAIVDNYIPRSCRAFRRISLSVAEVVAFGHPHRGLFAKLFIAFHVLMIVAIADFLTNTFSLILRQLRPLLWRFIIIFFTSVTICRFDPIFKNLLTNAPLWF